MQQEPNKLPPLDKEAFDGEKDEAKIHRDKPLPKICNHSGVAVVSGNELKCTCGAGWTGPDIVKLHDLFKKRA